MIAIVHATGIITITAIVGLVIRSVAPHLRAVLRELNVLVVIVLTARKRLSARTGLTMIHQLTDAGNVPAAGKIQRIAGSRKAGRTKSCDAVPNPAVRRQMPGSLPELPGSTFNAKSA